MIIAVFEIGIGSLLQLQGTPFQGPANVSLADPKGAVNQAV